MRRATPIFRSGLGNARAGVRGGFTLLEVLATMLLLAILLPVLMEGISLSLHAASDTRRITEATNLAQAELNTLVATNNWSNNSSSDFGTDHPGYRWESNVISGDNNVSQLTVTVLWTDRGQQRQLAVSTIVYANNEASAAGSNGINTSTSGTTSGGSL